MLLRARLEQTGFFGARFRENAARALLLPRQGFGRRTPLWLNRQRAKKLLDGVCRYEDFPITLETWRTCLRDSFDLDRVESLLQEVRDGIIRVTETSTPEPSPFAEGSVWRLTNLYMYEDDSAPGRGPSSIREDLLKEVAFTSEFRPKLSRSLVETFEQKAQRVFPGYAPRTADDLLDWLKERLVIPRAEWNALLEAVARDHGLSARSLTRALNRKVVEMRWGGRHGRCA